MRRKPRTESPTAESIAAKPGSAEPHPADEARALRVAEAATEPGAGVAAAVPTAAATSAAPITPLSRSQLRAASAALLTTILLGALDQTIVSVAVPAIARQLGDFEWVAWVISGYLIASTVVTPLYGKLSDLFGRRLMMSAAIGIFLVASVACALAQTMPQLVAARVLQGVGGGGLITMAQAVIADVMPLRERGRYQSYVSIVWAVASMVGPVVGGVLTDALSWPWIFWVNLPPGLLALWLVWRALATLPVQRRVVRIDWLGAGLLLCGSSAFLIPVTRVGQGQAWNEPHNLAGWALAVVLLAGFVRQQRRHPEAIVPMALLRSPVVVAGCGLLFVCFFNFIALSVLVPLRLQLVGGLSAAEAGARLLPMTLAVPAAAFFGGRWLHRTGRVLPLQRAGAWLVPLGLAGLGAAGPSGAAATLALVVTGFGMGLQMPSTLISVQQSVPAALVGTATALTAFFRLLGGAVGIAILSSVLLVLMRAHLAPGGPALGAEGLGALLGPAHHAAASDRPFQWVLWTSALISLAAPALVSRLPDLRLLDGAAAPRA